MPTPFTHLAYAHHLLDDPNLPSETHTFLKGHLPAFLLGSVAADARVDAKDSRAATHFYTYTEPMRDHPWRVMLAKNPSLSQPSDAHLRAFTAGYVFHLGMDEYWSRQMLSPHFADGEWGESRAQRFFVLHLLLIAMDERDLKQLPKADSLLMKQSVPHHWLPFMSDHILENWRDFITEQITHKSQTLEIFGARINQTPEQLRPILDSSEQMHTLLYQHLTPPFLADFEAKMYDFSKEQLSIYLSM